MAVYKCFFCGKIITHKIFEKNLKCSSCGSKIFFKPRKVVKKLKAI